MLSNKCTVIISYCSQWFSLGAYPWDALYGRGNILAFALASFFSCSRCAPSSQAVQLSSLSLNYMKSSLRTEEPAGAAAGQQRRNHRRHAAVPLRPQFRQGQILRHPPRCVVCVTFPLPVRRSGDGGDCVRSFLR